MDSIEFYFWANVRLSLFEWPMNDDDDVILRNIRILCVLARVQMTRKIELNRCSTVQTTHSNKTNMWPAHSASNARQKETII